MTAIRERPLTPQEEQAVCPNVARHTKHPASYLVCAEWAEKKSRTHKQKKCEGCGYWVIWEKKP